MYFHWSRSLFSPFSFVLSIPWYFLKSGGSLVHLHGAICRWCHNALNRWVLPNFAGTAYPFSLYYWHLNRCLQREAQSLLYYKRRMKDASFGTFHCHPLPPPRFLVELCNTVDHKLCRGTDLGKSTKWENKLVSRNHGRYMICRLNWQQNTMLILSKWKTWISLLWREGDTRTMTQGRSGGSWPLSHWLLASVWS